MADETTKVKETKPAEPTVVPAESNPTLEDKTANDGALLINQDAANVAPAPAAEPTVVTPAEVPAPVAPITTTPEAPAPAAEEPVVVNTQDVAEVNHNETENLRSEIEGLTGEIQALETKIERLTGSASAPAEVLPATPAEPVMPETPKETPKVEKSEEKPVEAPAPAPMPEPKVEPAPAMPSPKVSASPINDIYSKIGAPEPKKPVDDLSDLGASDGPTAMAMIGEVISILGIIITLLLVASPLFRDMIGKSLFGTISSVGWLTTVATLALGFLFSVLGKAKTIIIVLGLIFLIVSGLIYVGVSYPSALGQLPESLDSLFAFYRP